jgi:Ca-activated chloride channel family protein
MKLLLLCLVFSPTLYANEINNNAGLQYIDEDGVTHTTLLLHTDVEMRVNGLINRVKVTQEFVNDSDQWINGQYLFPLPDNAAVDHLRMIINERVIIGEIKEKAIAQKEFTEAKKAGKKATLINQQRNNIFTTTVANIAPHETVQIEIEYQQAVDYKAGIFSLHFPMTITPRYSPDTKKLTSEQRGEYLACLDNQSVTSDCQAKWYNLMASLESKKMAQQTVSHIKTEMDPDLLVELQVYLNSPLPITNIISPYHDIDIKIENEESTLISLTDKKVIADRDFELNWQVSQGEQSQSAMFVEQQEGIKYGALMVVPPAQEHAQTSRISKEVVFVIDVSGSMSGSSIRQARSALKAGIDQLGKSDTFNIISFSDSSEFFANNALPVDSRSKVMAKDFIEQLEASGGTNMESAIQASLLGKRTVNENKEQAMRQIVFITDASIGNEDQLLTQIEQQLGTNRLFMVGIGSAPNRYFMKASATLGKGTYTNIGDINEVQAKISALFNQISTPVLRDIKLTWDDGSEVDYWPKPTKDLYLGEPLQLSFKIPEDKTSINIEGVSAKDNQNVPWSDQIDIDNQNRANGIAVLWAKSQIDSIDLNRSLSADIKKHGITDLGLRFHIVTKHTSLIAVEQKVVRPENIESQNQQIKTHLPKGNTMRLPQTGLATDFYQEIGLWILLLAGLFWSLDIFAQQLKNRE